MGFYPVSMSCRTLVYKGMLLADQLGGYYSDLEDPRFESAIALVHQRFSTNTFPTWSLSHPYRMVAHNGEINTLRGNVNWMAARQASVDSEDYGNDISKLWPISYEGQSDTACFDNALEFLVQGGYSLTHAMMMLIPEAWAGNPLMDDTRRAFYEYHAMGRPRRRGIHRRPPDRRYARPQRPPASPLFRHQGRSRGDGLRNGRAADPGEGHHP
jgi:glutamate synthase (NADPH) large chain